MVLNIIAAISAKIDMEFGESYTIYTEPVEQGFTKPCFFILNLSEAVKNYIGGRYFISYRFQITCYPTDQEPNTQLSDISGRLHQILEFLVVEGRLLRGAEITSKTQNNQLVFEISYGMFEVKQEEEVFMEDIEVESKTTTGRERKGEF